MEFATGAESEFVAAIEEADLSDYQDVIEEKTIVQKYHQAGAPNSSFPASAQREIEALEAIGAALNSDLKPTPMFGTRIRRLCNSVIDLIDR